MSSPITVVAIRRGYYGQLREPGDRFEVASARDVGRWMSPVVEAEPAIEPEPVAKVAPAATEPARGRRHGR